MFKDDFVFAVALAKLVAITEYLRCDDNEQVCGELDNVVSAFSGVLSNLKEK